MLGWSPDNVWNSLLAPLHDRITKLIFDPLPSLTRKIKPPPRMIMEIGVARGIGAKFIIRAAKRAGATMGKVFNFVRTRKNR